MTTGPLNSGSTNTMTDGGGSSRLLVQRWLEFGSSRLLALLFKGKAQEGAAGCCHWVVIFSAIRDELKRRGPLDSQGVARASASVTHCCLTSHPPNLMAIHHDFMFLMTLWAAQLGLCSQCRGSLAGCLQLAALWCFNTQVAPPSHGSPPQCLYWGLSLQQKCLCFLIARPLGPRRAST